MRNVKVSNSAAVSPGYGNSPGMGGFGGKSQAPARDRYLGALYFLTPRAIERSSARTGTNNYSESSTEGNRAAQELPHLRIPAAPL